ncbi:unnamed protein product [Cylicocyclus nassatus]|uniref:Uncharacterized protein n=1 Tax=Cylicocyclus nassatus TaxID=53992 RepID=A0AA36DLV0_CYLNA|nr:unnamed protein product [Cylicocyclus nassatus]
MVHRRRAHGRWRIPPAYGMDAQIEDELDNIWTPLWERVIPSSMRNGQLSSPAGSTTGALVVTRAHLSSRGAELDELYRAVISLLGSYKARITKAAKALREKISEVDEATLQPLDPAMEASKDPHFILSHKSSLFLKFALIERAIAHLRAQREKAEEFARQNPDVQGEFPFLQQIQDHWDAGELD